MPHPLLIGQFDFSKQSFNYIKVFRPGIGLTSTFYFNSIPNLKASLQATYAIPLQTVQTKYTGLIIECKIGIGINLRIHPIFKRNKENEVECDESE